jgi:hypothetical protein
LEKFRADPSRFVKTASPASISSAPAAAGTEYVCPMHAQIVRSEPGSCPIQAHLRHARPNVTAEVYMQEIPASVRAAVESLDQKLTGCSRKLPSIEPN